jgi:hypothetical protein
MNELIVSYKELMDKRDRLIGLLHECKPSIKARIFQAEIETPALVDDMENLLARIDKELQ